jgi:hypothetical protein
MVCYRMNSCDILALFSRSVCSSSYRFRSSSSSRRCSYARCFFRSSFYLFASRSSDYRCFSRARSSASARIRSCSMICYISSYCFRSICSSIFYSRPSIAWLPPRAVDGADVTDPDRPSLAIIRFRASNACLSKRCRFSSAASKAASTYLLRTPFPSSRAIAYFDLTRSSVGMIPHCRQASTDRGLSITFRDFVRGSKFFSETAIFRWPAQPVSEK